MNGAHMHLLVNHWPVVCLALALLLLLSALRTGSEVLMKAAFAITLLGAALGVMTYFTGEPAEEVVEKLPHISQTLIERHEDFAEIAVVAIGFMGLLSLTALLLGLRSGGIPRSVTVASAPLLLATLVLIGYTANVGGQIHHSEIRSHSPPTRQQEAREHRLQQPKLQARPTESFRRGHVGIKRHLDHLGDRVGSLATAEPAEQRKTMTEVVKFLREHLRPHAEWEEMTLYPAVDERAGEGMNVLTATMRHEHEIVGRWIDELASEAAGSEPDVNLFSRRADNLLGLIAAHFEEEEEVLLPILDRSMTPEQFQRELMGGVPHD